MAWFAAYGSIYAHRKIIQKCDERQKHDDRYKHFLVVHKYDLFFSEGWKIIILEHESVGK